LFHDKALSWESIIILLTPPTCEAYAIEILLHDHCAIHAPPPTPPLNAIHHTILAMAISCKGLPVYDMDTYIQGECIHKTGYICIEYRILFLVPRIQHVGRGEERSGGGEFVRGKGEGGGGVRDRGNP